MNVISRHVSTNDLEEILSSNSSNISIELTSSEEYPPGLFTLLLQVLCTKIRRDNNLQIDTNIASINEEEILKKFQEYTHLLCLLLFKNSLIIRDKNGFLLKRDRLISSGIQFFNIQEDLYSMTFDQDVIVYDSKISQLKELNRRLFSDRSPQKINRGVNFFIPCFDHIDMMSRTSYFYDNDGMLRSKEEVATWVTKIFHYNKLNIRSGLERNRTQKEIAFLIKELFDNTEHWARTHYSDREYYRPNIRTCYINIFMGDRLANLATIEGEFSSSYVSTILQSELQDLNIPDWQSEFMGTSTVGICEISIMDSGPGMARRWLKKNYDEINIEEETEAVVECFNKYVTSDTSTKGHVRGRGLNSVVRLIGKNGFISVRTGRLQLLRDFIKGELTASEMQSGLNFEIKERSLIEGTSLSILYPFVYQP